MALVFTLCAFVFGAIVGSSLNVMILRHNTGISFARKRSFCDSCGKTLSPIELIPILSFFIQRGRCRTCGSRLSWQYPIVEFATGVFFAGIFLKNFAIIPSSPLLYLDLFLVAH